jgi:hypothetical protein
MSTTAQTVASAIGYRARSSAVAADATSIPWVLYAVAAAATIVVIGIIWDISWHITIGRDTFWTPAHMCTYVAGAIVGVTCGWVALKTTFAGTAEERESSIGVWGFRAPLGVWICVWGAFAMLTSAPFDDWWHNAYGLDVKIISPPHALLVLGIVCITVGAMVWTLAWQNRTTVPALKARLARLYVYDAGMFLGMVAIFVTEYNNRVLQHTSLFYRACAFGFPFVLVAVARGSTLRWPATLTALVFMAVRIVMGWILPLWSATPKLGPIYNAVDHMVPMQFPLLLVVPAFAIDLLMHRLGKSATRTRDWVTAPLYGVAFMVALAVVQWPFASFLNSPAARNWFFFADRFPYTVPHSTLLYQYRFVDFPADHVPMVLAMSIFVTLLYASLSAGLGLTWGRWLTRVQR